MSIKTELKLKQENAWMKDQIEKLTESNRELRQLWIDAETRGDELANRVKELKERLGHARQNVLFFAMSGYVRTTLLRIIDGKEQS